MKFAGIIAEYDPFHNGHAAQLAAVRQRAPTAWLSVWSSGAVQRGGVYPSCRNRSGCARWAQGRIVIALPRLRLRHGGSYPPRRGASAGGAGP